jgi:hypothetical protein
MKLASMVVVVLAVASPAAYAEVVSDPDPASAPAPPPDPAGPTASMPAPVVGPPPSAPAPASSGPRITVMWAPIRLIIPVAEFTVEYRIAPKLGASIELGAGKRTLTTGSTDVKGTEIEGGAQFRYYVLGSFRKGLEVGAEILDEYVTFKEPLPAGVAGVAAGGVTAGPFLGYKVATHAGFTFEAQAGARYLVAYPAVTGQGSSSDIVGSRWLPLLHINIGWSF